MRPPTKNFMIECCFECARAQTDEKLGGIWDFYTDRVT